MLIRHRSTVALAGFELAARSDTLHSPNYQNGQSRGWGGQSRKRDQDDSGTETSFNEILAKIDIKGETEQN
ncbi:MAG TPA: hypothetical protein VFK24_07010 [Gammaproteobacteria bacterium]|nr:hypothetical protein [Gammaproteobacteria bacterium]